MKGASALMMAAMFAATARVKGIFGVGMSTERAAKLISHVSPAQYAIRGTTCGRNKKTNRLHLSRKAKDCRRKAANG